MICWLVLYSTFINSHLRNIPLDYDIPTLEILERQIGTEQMFLEYFDQQYDMLVSIKPIVVGHFDLIRLWRHTFKISGECWVKIKRNIDFINEYGGIIELNSRAYKKGLPSAYPLSDILQVMIEKQSRFTLSDDSHGPEDVAMHYSKLKIYCQEMGILKVYAPWKQDDKIVLEEYFVKDVLKPW